MAITDTINQNFFQKCLPPLRTNVATAGLLSLCDALPIEIDDLDTIFSDGTKFRVMNAWYQHDIELRACRALQNSWYDFFMTQRVDMSAKIRADKVNSGLIRIIPYILALRHQPINNNYWKVTAGTASDGTAVDSNGGGTINTHWQMTLTSDNSEIPPSTRWFNANERLYVKSLAPDGTVANTEWKVVGSAVSGSSVKVWALPLNAGSYSLEGGTYTFLDAGTPSELSNPVTGVAVRGTARVSSFEAFCSFPPGLIDTTEDAFWIEETRDSFQSDEQYEEWRNALVDQNPLFAEIYDLPLQAYNRQVGEDFQRRFVHNVLYGKPISASQTLSTFNSLDNISVTNWSNPGGAEYCTGKAAHAIGIREQMRQLNRVQQLHGDPLNIPNLARSLYNMMRVRGTKNPKAAQIFEVFMPSHYRPVFNTAMLEYYKTQSAGLLQLHQDVTRNRPEAPLGFYYRDYPLEWPDNVTLRVMTSDFTLDDEAAAAKRAGVEFAGNQLWIKDWSGVKIGVLGSETVTRRTGDLNILQHTSNVAACTIRSHIRTTRMTGMAYTIIDECPQGDLLIEGFSNAKPTNTDDNTTEYGSACTAVAP